jgi:hypothetical protein
MGSLPFRIPEPIPMRILALPLLLLAACASLAPPDAEWEKSVLQWRERTEKSLRADNGWLTLAGRFVMKPGVNTFGTGAGNDIVFPRGLGPDRIGTITIAGGKVTMKLAPGVTVRKEGMDLDEVVLGTDIAKRDWVTMGRLAMHVIAREDRHVLPGRQRSEVRRASAGRVWYEPNAAYRVSATFVPYPPGRKVTSSTCSTRPPTRSRPASSRSRSAAGPTGSMPWATMPVSSSCCATPPRAKRPTVPAASSTSRRSPRPASPSCST